MRQARPPKDIPPPLELECLKVLWILGEGNVKAVQKELEGRRRLAYTTVMTLLDRLARRNVVSRRKMGRAFVYAPLVDRESLRRKAVAELVENLFDNRQDALLAYIQNGSAAPRALAEEEEDRLDTSLL